MRACAISSCTPTACSIPRPTRVTITDAAPTNASSSARRAADRALIGRVWREYLKKRWRQILVILPVIAVAGAAAGGYVAIVQEAGGSLEEGDARAIYQVPAWILGISLVRAAAMYAQTVLMNDLANRVLRDLQERMFASLLKADYARIVREPAGALVARFLNDIAVISESIVRTASALLRDVITIISVIGVMLWIDPVLALGVVALLGVSVGPLARIAKRARAQTKEAQQQVGALASVLFESLAGARLVRTYGLEGYEAKRAQAEFEARRRMAMKLAFNRARSDPILEALGGVAAALVFAFIGWRVAHGETGLKDLLSLITAIAAASASARSLGAYNTVLNEGVAAAERVFALIDEPPSIVERPGAPALRVSEGRIAFEGVSFGYDGGSSALKEVSFAIAPGERVALVGPSGAGKSTVFNLIPRLFDVTAGSVSIDGQDVRDVTLSSLRAAIAVVSQDIVLFNDTVRANIAFGRSGASEAEIVAAAKAAAAHDFIAGLPQGYDTPCGERGGALSGGERQRIALARAFLRDAPILLLDEATSALDAESERRVQEALDRLTKGRTTLIIAHRLATVRDADRILVMEGGRIVEVGRHEELVAKGGLYARLARLQFREGEAAP